jgi:4-hydroxybenzoate polyprenyltransferase
MSVRSIARTLHTVVAVLFVVGLIAQVWLAGRGVFESPTMFDTHRSLGYTLSLFTIALLVLGLLGGMGRRPAILAVVIFVLFILQSVFVVMRDSQPAVAALHPVNGFLILFLAIVLARDSWMMRTAPATP